MKSFIYSNYCAQIGYLWDQITKNLLQISTAVAQVKRMTFEKTDLNTDKLKVDLGSTHTIFNNVVRWSREIILHTVRVNRIVTSLPNAIFLLQSLLARTIPKISFRAEKLSAYYKVSSRNDWSAQNQNTAFYQLSLVRRRAPQTRRTYWMRHLLQEKRAPWKKPACGLLQTHRDTCLKGAEKFRELTRNL